MYFMGGLLSKAVFKSGKEALPKQQLTSFFEARKKNIDGEIIDFQQFRGRYKCFIVVNVACK